MRQRRAVAALATEVAQDELRMHIPHARVDELLVRRAAERIHGGVEAIVDDGLDAALEADVGQEFLDALVSAHDRARTRA